MLEGIFILLAFQLLGEIVAHFAGGLVPGPVMGMALIAITLSTLKKYELFSRGREAVVAVATVILGSLGILFVPAGVGIVQHVGFIRSHGFVILAIVSISTVATLVVTVWTFVLVKRVRGTDPDE